MRWVSVTMGAVVLAGCFSQLRVPPLAAEPRIEVERAVFDFGAVPLGREVRHVFEVENRGRKPLTLVPGRSECACTSTVSPGGTIAAGDSGWVEVAFDTSREAGPRVRTVTVETNDPQTPELVLTVRGTVVADVTIVPDRIFFGRVPIGVSRERTIEIETEPGVRLLKVKKDSRRFDVRVVGAPAPESGVRLHVVLHPSRRRGPFDDEVIVTTTSDRQPRVVVPVLGFIE